MASNYKKHTQERMWKKLDVIIHHFSLHHFYAYVIRSSFTEINKATYI